MPKSFEDLFEETPVAPEPEPTGPPITVEDLRQGTFVFLSGGAGTGKTFLARELAQTEEGAQLCSTTGIAAVNLGDACTINSLLRYFDTADLARMYTSRFLHVRLKDLRRAGITTLVLDEVSMLAAGQLTCLVKAIEEVNEERGFDLGLESAYFGDEVPEIRLVLVGDFCLARGTRVMRADGRLIVVEDVTVGMDLMGPDGRPRRVQRLTMGAGPLYRVDQTNGDSYVTNELHSLALRRSVDGTRLEGTNLRYREHGQELYLTVHEFKKKSRKFRECFVGYKAGLVEFASRTYLIDPYFLGVWLGDGDSDGPRITTADPEIVEVCQSQAAAWGLGTTVHRWARTKAIRIRLTNGRKAGHVNPLWQAFRRYELDGRKHIPDDYLYGRSDVRLQLLAGLLDTDGNWGGNRYSFSTTNGLLATQVKQLADQLGFRTAIRKITAGWYANPDHGEAWYITIGGDTWRIPCRIPRKQSKPRSLGRSRLTSVLKVTPVGEGGYVGFQVDGDSLFLLADGTVTHNCQLPPVKAPFAFESPEWDRFAGHTLKLTKVWRQQDQAFCDALRCLRRGDATAALEVFRPCFTDRLDPDFSGTTIVAKNDLVDRINTLRHDRLEGPLHTWPATRSGEQQKDWQRLIPDALSLKEGALVMILANRRDGIDIHDPYLYVNGDLATVLPQTPDPHTGKINPGYCEVKVHRTGETERVVAITREWKVPTPDDWKAPASSPKMLKPRSVIKGAVTYLPLRLAYASTVHKSQGLTLDEVQVGIADPFFGAPAMLYVALSRARSLEKLKIVTNERIFLSRCSVDRKVTSWL